MLTLQIREIRKKPCRIREIRKKCCRIREIRKKLCRIYGIRKKCCRIREIRKKSLHILLTNLPYIIAIFFLYMGEMIIYGIVKLVFIYVF